MAGATTIYVIRHAHAAWREDDDRPLSEAGLKAAAIVADRLASRPITAIYSSPSRRSLQTVEPLARRFGLRAETIVDLRERELPIVPPENFESVVRQAWSSPDEAPGGGESNVRAQARGLAVVQSLVARHAGSEIALGTHGNLLALILNALDAKHGYELWRALSFPDIYKLTFDGASCQEVERMWNASINAD